MLSLWRKRSYREELQEQSQEAKVSYCCKEFLTYLLCCVCVFLSQPAIAKARCLSLHISYVLFFFFLIAAVQEVIHYHQIDLALLVVAGAVAEVTVEVAATGELWTVQFFDVS